MSCVVGHNERAIRIIIGVASEFAWKRTVQELGTFWFRRWLRLFGRDLLGLLSGVHNLDIFPVTLLIELDQIGFWLGRTARLVQNHEVPTGILILCGRVT
jgi:hypothetical protein